jgi:glutamate-1-semialdehyde 2,1-aminomutase
MTIAAAAATTAGKSINIDIEAALLDTRERYAGRNPESRARYAQACAAMPGGNTRTVLFFAPFPLAIARGEGCRLWDADGHEYVDFLAEYTAGLYGHSHPAIRASIDRALDGGINLSGHNLVEAALARAVCDRFPSIDLVRFTNSGTEANLMALATATVVTGRRKILVFDGGYHGGLLYFGGGGIPINAPHDFVVGRYNDAEDTRRLIERNGPDLAAILVEPMMGTGGCIPATGDFLQLLRDAASRHGAILIFDEVMTSRLAPGGLQEAHGIIPDMTTLGKYLGGGMSFGAFGGKAEIMALYDPRRPDGLPHAGTFNNNVLSMSAGLAGITEIFTPDACRALNARGDALRERLNGLCRARGARMQFTGRGSMMTVHFTTKAIGNPSDAAHGDPKLKELFFFDMLERGIYLARRGMVALSLPIGDAECDRLAAAVDDFLETRQPLLRAADSD